MPTGRTMTKTMPDLDVTLVSGRRPDLLRRTLASFQDRIFANFSVANFYANIDPIFGDADDHAACRDAIRSLFPDAVITEPAEPSFGRAVKTLWAATRSKVVLHLEDDWVMNEQLRPEDVFPLLSGNVSALMLVAKLDGQGRAKLFNEKTRKVKFLGVTVRRKSVSTFGTSPRFLSGDFARGCAALMDPDLDPEKQMRKRFNPPLRAYTQGFRCRILQPKGQTELITDIGRAWRDTRNIEKSVAGGVSTWTT